MGLCPGRPGHWSSSSIGLESFRATWPVPGERDPNLHGEQGGSPGQDHGETRDGGEAEWAGGPVPPYAEYLYPVHPGCLPSRGRRKVQQLGEGDSQAGEEAAEGEGGQVQPALVGQAGLSAGMFSLSRMSVLSLN